MPLSTEVVSEIDLFVRGGFEDRDRIIEIVTEEMYEPGELNAEEVEAAVDAATALMATQIPPPMATSNSPT